MLLTILLSNIVILLIILLAVILLSVIVFFVIKNNRIKNKLNKVVDENNILKENNHQREDELKKSEDKVKELIEKLSNVPVTIKDELLTKGILEDNIKKLRDEIEGLNKQKLISQDEINKLEEIINNNIKQKGDLANELNNLLNTIKQSRKILSDIESNEYGYLLPQLNSTEKDLVKILNEIIYKYPIIADDIKSISWKRLWLPKIQNIVKLCNSEGVMGVYKITIQSGEAVYNYVGKANNIKDRWYNHLKKMIGIEQFGNEALYKYIKVDDIIDGNINIYFSILEKVDDECYLSECEHRWISSLGDFNIKK